MRSIELEVRTQAGLHARPAAAFVRAVAAFRSTVQLQNVTLGRPAVDARSVVGILSAGVEMGHLVRIVAVGADEKRAVEVLSELLASPDQAVGKQAASGRVAGRPAAPGIAVGPPWWYAPGPVSAAPREAAEAVVSGDEDDAESLIRGAAETAAAQLNALAARLCAADRPGDAEILEAQALMAVDPAIIDEAVRRSHAGVAPAIAVIDAAEASAVLLAGLDDALLAARAADVRDVAARVVRVLDGTHLNLPDAPSILIADDLPPSLLAEMSPGMLLGVALSGGSPTAHVAILARSLGVPAVVAAAGLLAVVRGAAAVAIDGDTGEVIADPDEAELRVLADRRAVRAARARADAALRGRPAATCDGKRIALFANIRSPDEAARAIASGAEGVGLFRTEYLFLRRQSAPSEQEQVAAYRQAMEAFGAERPVVIRLADIGGDKSIPYLGRPEEPNPFLGVRAIRLAGDSRDLLLTQLRAIWRAAGMAGVTPHVMAAMVATLADARMLLDLRDEARAQVDAADEPCPERMVTGVMIEVPSAAMMAPELARMVDFFSIGTNDLTQYVLAADRGNPSLARFQDALHPAVLRTVAAVIAGARTAGIPVAVCGELAGDPAGAVVLVGLGVDELSADVGSLDGVRAALAKVTSAELRVLAVKSLAATDAETVRAAANELLRARV